MHPLRAWKYPKVSPSRHAIHAAQMQFPAPHAIQKDCQSPQIPSAGAPEIPRNPNTPRHHTEPPSAPLSPDSPHKQPQSQRPESLSLPARAFPKYSLRQSIQSAWSSEISLSSLPGLSQKTRLQNTPCASSHEKRNEIAFRIFLFRVF